MQRVVRNSLWTRCPNPAIIAFKQRPI
jgi:hypothetical protein